MKDHTKFEVNVLVFGEKYTPHQVLDYIDSIGSHNAMSSPKFQYLDEKIIQKYVEIYKRKFHRIVKKHQLSMDQEISYPSKVHNKLSGLTTKLFNDLELKAVKAKEKNK